jgi:4-diphosphocytidyl-2-C-methyl-D-erythritol kinase
MQVRRFTAQLEVLAPAKINLFLEVLARRPDGFHEIRTVLAPLGVYDSVVFEPTDEPDIVLYCRWAHGLAAHDRIVRRDAEPARELLFGEIPQGPENLAARAAGLLREHAGITSGARICLVKRIPAAAGLGGASSDAAAVLLAGNAGWRLHWSRERLCAIAAELGSDVPFFLMRGAAMALGRGEQTRELGSRPLHLVVVRPPVGLSTPRVYAACRPTPDSKGADELIASLSLGNAALAAERMTNHLQSPASALTPWIERLQQEFDRQPVLGHQMSGSGSSYFALARSARQARRLAAVLRARDIGWSRSATTLVNN